MSYRTECFGTVFRTVAEFCSAIYFAGNMSYGMLCSATLSYETQSTPKSQTTQNLPKYFTNP